MKISVNEVPKILEENYKNYLLGKPCNNLMFECTDDEIMKRVIVDHFNNSSVRCIRENLWPDPLYVTDKQTRICTKKKPTEYVISDNVLSLLVKEPTVFFYERLNWLYSWACENEGKIDDTKRQLLQLIDGSEFVSFTNNHYDMRNRIFTVATTFPEKSGNTIVPIPEFEKIFRKFEVSLNHS